MIGIIFGKPGTGKGTQAPHIADQFGVCHVSTGEMLREAVGDNTVLGKEAAPIMSAGDLVPDELMVRIIEERLEHPDAHSGVLLDGFPRTIPQAVALDDMLRRTGRRVDLLLHLDVPEDKLVARLLRRSKVDGRADDNPDSITRRMEQYARDTAPVLEYYRSRGTRVESIDGDASIAEVEERIDEIFARIPGVSLS